MDSGIMLSLPAGDDCWYRWRRIDKDDISSILRCLPSHLARLPDPWLLECSINDSINFFEGMPTGQRLRFKNRSLPHVRLKSLKKLRVALIRAAKHSHDRSYDELSQQIAKHLTIIDKDIEEAQLEQALRSKKGPKEPDQLRYDLIVDLAVIFETAFQTPVTQHADGAWCSFLVAVLSRVEGKELSNEGALWLTRRIRPKKNQKSR